MSGDMSSENNKILSWIIDKLNSVDDRMFKIESTNFPAKGSKDSTSDDNLSKNSEKTDHEVEEVKC